MDNIEKLIVDLGCDMQASESRLVGLITDVKESLERELRSGFDGMKIDSTFNPRGWIGRPRRWTNRMNDWAEKVDIAIDKQSEELIKKNEEIAELRGRLEKLERGN
jgi:hypothetical protein